MQESLATLNKYRMRWRNITEGRVETVDAVNWGGHSFKLKVIWNPTTTQLDRLFDSSKDNFVRGLVSGADVVVWDAYQTEHEATRTLGMMDTNIDGKVAKDEVRGRMAQMLLANWDKVDLNKNGFIDEDEMAPINAQMNGRIKQAQAQQSIGQ